MLPIFLTAMGLGLAVAAPVGPVGTTVIRQGMLGGWSRSFWVGQGAALTDFVYILATWIGLTPLLTRFTALPLILYGAGTLMMGRMAVGALTEAFRGEMNALASTGPEAAPSGPWYRALVLGLGVTVINPATITIWLSLGGAFISANLAGRSSLEAILLMSGIWLGSALWYSTLAVIVGVARAAVERIPWLFRAVAASSGLVLLAFTLGFAWKFGTGILALWPG
jgi:putative LysE/RhtB family amino acid efflux pump